MNRRSCQGVRRLLVEYADGELPAEEATGVEAHLADCRSCQELLRALRASIDLAREVWSESVERGEALRGPHRQSPRVSARRAAVAACVAAACAAIVVGVWWPRTPPAGLPPKTPGGLHTVENIHRIVRNEGISAELAATARILARQPGGVEFAHRLVDEIARSYPDTLAGKEARRKGSTHSGERQ